MGILKQTFYRWRIKYGALKEDEAQRLKALEQESSRLKKIVAEQALDISPFAFREPPTRSSNSSPAASQGSRFANWPGYALHAP